LLGQHFCPACLETGKSKRKIQNLENQRTRYDSIALSLAVLPMLIFYFTIITAPMALFVAIRYWRAPASLVGQNRTRYLVAILVALLQIAGWITLIFFLAHHKS
jgi:hypothetical protein